MVTSTRLAIVWAACMLQNVSAFTPRPQLPVATAASSLEAHNANRQPAHEATPSVEENHERPASVQRRSVLTSGILAAGTMLQSSQEAQAENEGVTMYKLASGLKYIELKPSTDPDAVTPRYGQLCIVDYTAYIKLPNDKEKQKFDEATSFLIKHGNGKMIGGLDEGLHTMKKGSTRRLIIPPKLGFVDIGLGPMPSYPWDRSKLNKKLDQMVEQRGGNLIYDVTLTRVLDDEADQGYYEDGSPTEAELEVLRQQMNSRR